MTEVRGALRTFAQQLLKMRGLEEGMTVAADGKSCRGVWEKGRQLELATVHIMVYISIVWTLAASESA